MGTGTTTVFRWLGRSAIAFAILVIVLIVAVLIAQRVSDGPMGPLQGGSFRSGELVPGPVANWLFVEQTTGMPEIELVAPQTSRIAGLMLNDGQLYIPCDLGFMANRSWGSSTTLWFGRAMSVLKRWHIDAVEDGRVVIRLDGKRYGGQVTKVIDPDLVAALRAQVEQMAKDFGGLESLPPAPTEEPNDIWFFHVAPRAI